MRRQTAALLVASFSFLAGSACLQERKAATLQSVESLSFVEALAKKSVAEREYSLGPITRPGLVALQHSETAPRRSFDSDPVEIAPGGELLVTMGMFSFDLETSEDDRPTFRVDISGPNGETRLL